MEPSTPDTRPILPAATIFNPTLFGHFIEIIHLWTKQHEKKLD
jgi:hypothetical protein